jgi:hypothetical protein
LFSFEKKEQMILSGVIMKTIRKAAILWILLIGMIGVAPQETTAQVSVSFQLFYDNLSPHGYWIDNPRYGYVWVPNVSRGFVPYRTNGYWVYTEAGWTWASNYSWGWAPFHYGRWYYDSYYGWVWVPDTYWGPAWVTWRYFDGYYGWAAIGPGISVSLAYSNSYHVPSSHWVFVRESDFGRRNISNYYVSSANNRTYVNKAKVINNIHTDKSTKVRYHAGPSRADVQKRSKADFAQVNLKERSRPGQSVSGNEMQLYKPRVERGGGRGNKPAPAIVTRKNEVKSVNDKRDNTSTMPRREVKRERTPQANQPVRQPVNRSRETQHQREMQQQLRRQEMQMQRGEQRAKEQEMERRMKEPVQPNLDRNIRTNEPILEHPASQMRQREVLPQRGNDGGQRLKRQKPVRSIPNG